MDYREALSLGLEKRARDMPGVQRVRRYMRGRHDRSYMPKSHEREFEKLVQRAVGNWLPLVVDSIAQNLYVEGYRRESDDSNMGSWDYWRKNGMESKQSLVHRAALTYGEAYVPVLWGTDGPAMRVYSPLVMTVVQDDPDAEWPDAAVRRVRKRRTADGDAGVEWEVLTDSGGASVVVPEDAEGLEDYEVHDSWEHGLGVCPVVVFRNKWEDDPESPVCESGEVHPLIPVQDRLNDTTLGLLIAQQYSAFRQKWATGIDIPKDPKTGKPVETFQSAVHRLWATSSPDVQFGEFSQTDLSGYLNSQESAIKHMSAIAQVPPHYLLGGLVNISAEALAAAEAGLMRKASERQTILGESWGRVHRLAAAVSGDLEGAQDTDARVVWRDTEARSLSAAADALGKLGESLQIPREALWEMVPGVTPHQLKQWHRLKEEQAANSADMIAAELLNGDHSGWSVGGGSGDD